MNRRLLLACLCLCALAATNRVYRLQSPKDERPRKLLPPRLKIALPVTRRAAPVLPLYSVMLYWKPGPVTPTNLPAAGFFVWYGVASRTYTNKVDEGYVTNAIISQLYGLTNSAITYYFTLSAYATNLNESDWGNEISVKKLDRVTTVSAGTNSYALTNSVLTSQFFRLRGQGSTSAELLSSPSIRGPWTRITVWNYPAGPTPRLAISQKVQ